MNSERASKSNLSLWVIPVITAGFALRLVGLDSSSLMLNEAENALAALGLFSGESSGQLLYTLPTALFFRLFGISDFTARLIPALFGILLMFLPLFLTRYIGKKRALVLMLVAAVDPVLLFWSKRADAVIPAVFFAAAAAVFMIRSKPAGVYACTLIALSGGARALPALMVIGAGFLLCSITGRSDAAWTFRGLIGKHCLKLAAVVILIFAIACALIPYGIASFADGLAESFSAPSAWTHPGISAILMAVLIYCGIPLLLCCISCMRRNNVVLFLCVLCGMVLLLWWAGLPALPWVSCVLWIIAADVLTGLSARLQGPFDFAFLASAGILAGAYSFFYFRLVEMFNQQNGAEPLQLSWNGTVQTLPLTRTGASLILTVVSILIIALIVKILLGFFDSESVRRGLLCGCVIISSWGVITNIWNTAGFDRIGDHPAAPHSENSRNLLNGNYTAFTDSPLFSLIGEIRMKHGDMPAEYFGADLIADDQLLEWQLLKIGDFRQVRLSSAVTPETVVILTGTESSFSQNGYVGTVIQYEETVRWDRFSFMDWGKWLLFGGGAAADKKALNLWASGDMVYSSAE